MPKDLKDAGNRIVSILAASVVSDLLWEEAIRVVSDKVIVFALDGPRGESLHVGYPLFERLSRGDVDLVVAVGPAEEVERLGGASRRRDVPSSRCQRSATSQRELRIGVGGVGARRERRCRRQANAVDGSRVTG